MNVRLQKKQWYYDDFGYYSYVLLNTSECQVRTLIQIFEHSGLRVLLSGKSYRPANNGIQYQWYIRIADENSQDPTRDRISHILAPFEISKCEVLELGQGKPANSHTRIKTLLGKIASQNDEIQKTRALLDRTERRLYAATERASSIQKQQRKLSTSYQESQSELQKYRETVSRLEVRLASIQENASTIKNSDKIRRECEGKIQQFAHVLKQKNKELASYIDNFEPEIKKRDEVNAELQEEIAILKKKNTELTHEIERMTVAETMLESKNGFRPLFRELFDCLLPNVEFLGGSFDTLWREMQNPISAIKMLPKLGQEKGKRVRGTDGWLERHIGREWRVYYRKCNEDTSYRVLISHKNMQKEDIIICLVNQLN